MSGFSGVWFNEMGQENFASRSSAVDQAVALGEWLWPVKEMIDVYYQDRPLSQTARIGGGFPWAKAIVEAESDELSEVHDYIADHPGSHLNGARKALVEEVGDTAFGLVEMLRSRHPEELSTDELFFVYQAGRLLVETQQRYGVDVVSAGVLVNQDKNVENNPTWALRDVTGLEHRHQIVNRLETTRQGLRGLRNGNGRLSETILFQTLEGYGYAMDELVKRPALATAFLRQVAVNGPVLG